MFCFLLWAVIAQMGLHFLPIKCEYLIIHILKRHNFVIFTHSSKWFSFFTLIRRRGSDFIWFNVLQIRVTKILITFHLPNTLYDSEIYRMIKLKMLFLWFYHLLSASIKNKQHIATNQDCICSCEEFSFIRKGLGEGNCNGKALRFV